MSMFYKLSPLVLAMGLVGIAIAQTGGQPPRSRVNGATTAGVYVQCDGPQDCDAAITARGLACTRTVGCENRECQFAKASLATCACFESDVRLCPGNSDQMQFCVEVGANTTEWQRNNSVDVCGPKKVACPTGKEACPVGFRMTKFDGTNWVGVGDCVAEPACPAVGTTRVCSSGIAACPQGQQTFDGNRWGPCQAVGCPSVGTLQSCSTGRAECPNGQRRWSGTAWGACEPIGCPAIGDRRGCATGRPSCPQGLQTWNGSTWGACAGINCPVECAPGMRPGSSQPCQTGEQCAGRQVCGHDGRWSACSGPRACPSGWRREGDHCAWTSPQEHTHLTYYPHRAGNEAFAATGSLGDSRVLTPMYVEAVLAQWSNPPAGGGGNHCGKGDHPSAWVGCVHPGGGRGYGRDIRDREWESHTMIPLRCEAHDYVGIYKHTWGHDAAWHCTRNIELTVVRNHDPLTTCRY